MKFKFLEHTADIKFQAFGKTKEEAFANAALALANIITKDKIKDKMKKQITVSGEDDESLLLNFLEEFLFLLESENFILSKIKSPKIRKDKTELATELIGDKASNYELENHVKAITYNDMFIRKEKGKYVCQVVVDV